MRRLLSFTLLLLALGCHSSRDGDYIKFSGVTYNEDLGRYVLHQGELEVGEQRANMMGVLTYYGVSCRFENGEIAVLSQDTADLNFLWNITLKAQDPIWLKEHLVDPTPGEGH